MPITGRPKKTLVITDDERSALLRLTRRARGNRALAFRARLVLACADGAANSAVARRYRTTNATVGKWRQRFIDGRLDGIYDEPRVGAPRTISDEDVEAVIVKTLETTPPGETHWSTRTMAAKAGMSHTTVGRIWRTFGLKPHVTESFKISPDPQLIEKVRDVVGLYMNPPTNAAVFSFDEKSQIQALARLSGESPGGLDAGDYSVTISDSKGVTQTASFVVKGVEPLAVELIRNIGATTERSNDGKAQLSVKGGTPKYNIVWDTKQTGLSAPKLPLGSHSVTVTDANGCSQKIDFQTEKRILPELTGKLESGQTIRMRLLNLDTDSYVIQDESFPMLDELYDFMMEQGTVAIEIAGHTNNQPSDAFADELSTNRAKAVADYLIDKGIDPKRVVYKGYGKRYPLIPNTSAEGRKTNQTAWQVQRNPFRITAVVTRLPMGHKLIPLPSPSMPFCAVRFVITRS